MFKKLLFTLVFALVGFVGLEAQTLPFPCNGVQTLTACNCSGMGTLVADSAPCAANSGEAQIFLLVDVVDGTITTDPDTNTIISTSLTGTFTAPTGDYVMYSLVYSQADAGVIFPAIGLGTNIAMLQAMGTMTSPGMWTGTSPSFTLIASPLATVNGPSCGCGSTGGSTGSIGDMVTESCCGTGGIGGVTIALYGNMQNLLGTVVTNSAGMYDFTGLPAGSYQIVVGSDPNGGALSSSSFYNVTIADGENFDGADFSFCCDNTGNTTSVMTSGIGTCSQIDVSHAIDCFDANSYTVILTLGGPLAASGFSITRPDGSVVVTGAQNGYTDTNTYTIAAYPTYTYTVTSLADPSCAYTVNAIPAICSGPVPIELVDFDGTEAGKANYLHWATGSEFNNDYFSLLRSEDGINFELVSQVPSQGNSTAVQNYEFYDYDYRTSTTYYRLTQTDNNGYASTAGGVIVVERKDFSFDITNVYPVPSSDIVNIDYLQDKNGTISVNIYDVTGRIVGQFDEDANEGYNFLQLNIADYAVGTYFITLSTGNETVTAKFIKD